MAERTRPDRNALERAPEEAENETWLGDSRVYLTIPDGQPSRQPIDARVAGRRQPGGAGD
jgi:hypothetical protein